MLESRKYHTFDFVHVNVHGFYFILQERKEKCVVCKFMLIRSHDIQRGKSSDVTFCQIYRFHVTWKSKPFKFVGKKGMPELFSAWY